MVRMRESYKRFVKTWIRFANPWIRFVSWSRILTSKRFVLYRGSWILTLKDSFRIVNHESSQFSKIRLFLRILQILTNPEYYSTKRILKNRDSRIRILTNPEVLDSRIRTLKIRIVDSFREFVSWIRFVDSFRANKNLKLFDSFWFVRIRIWIPHP